MRLPVLLVLVVLAALTGCGGGGSPDAPGNGTDRAFVAAMIPHHESAIEMAGVGRARAESPFVAQLATDIIRTQRTELATLRTEDGKLARAGVTRGSLGLSAHDMAMGDDVATLRRAQPFDPVFLRLMIPHHEGALAIAKAEIAKGQDPALKRLAEQVVAGQAGEIRAMRGRLLD